MSKTERNNERHTLQPPKELVLIVFVHMFVMIVCFCECLLCECVDFYDENLYITKFSRKSTESLLLLLMIVGHGGIYQYDWDYYDDCLNDSKRDDDESFSSTNDSHCSNSDIKLSDCKSSHLYRC